MTNRHRIPTLDARDALSEPLLWQLWRPFVGIHRWFLHRGCPPTIRRLRGMTRVLHLTALITAMSTLTGVLGAVAVWFSMKALGPGDDAGLAVFGGIVGAGVVAPVSRWIGRAWWHALAGVVFSTIWFGVIDQVHDFFGELLTLAPEWDHLVQWGLTTTTWCLGMAAWMMDVRRPQTLWILVLGGGAGVSATACKVLADQLERSGSLQKLPFANHELLNFLMNFQPILVMLVLLCASLGMRLWWDRSSEVVSVEADREDASGDQGAP